MAGWIMAGWIMAGWIMAGWIMAGWIIGRPDLCVALVSRVLGC
jgi:hypothetical protein